MVIMPGSGTSIPPVGKVHPWEVAKVASKDKDKFVSNYLSAHTSVSKKAVIFYVCMFVAFLAMHILIS